MAVGDTRPGLTVTKLADMVHHSPEGLGVDVVAWSNPSKTTLPGQGRGKTTNRETGDQGKEGGDHGVPSHPTYGFRPTRWSDVNSEGPQQERGTSHEHTNAGGVTD